MIIINKLRLFILSIRINRLDDLRVSYIKKSAKIIIKENKLRARFTLINLKGVK